MLLASLCDDFLAEVEDLHGVVGRLETAAADSRTAFFNWSIRDQIMHLHQVDGFGLSSLAGDDVFARVLEQVRADQANGIELSQQAREEFRHLNWTDLVAVWREDAIRLAGKLRGSAEKRRMAWFGPSMSVVSFATSRQMETWAHAQDICDLLGIVRNVRPSIRNICDIGVRTFGWSFSNRGLVPPARPAVELQGPGGERWVWPGEGGGEIKGSALHFALVVTQRRAPQDVDLEVFGEQARTWLPIAQCFAGAPQQPAAPGSRPRI